MLLYTRLAPPKPPKQRSRAGCLSCKEKKKKCDEERPQCNRCAERSLDCIYEPVKPRQRRKRNSTAPNPRSAISQLPISISYPPGRKLSEDSNDSQDASHGRWGCERHPHHGPVDEFEMGDLTALSPLETSFDTSPLIPAFLGGPPPTALLRIASPRHSFPYDLEGEDETAETTWGASESRRRGRRGRRGSSSIPTAAVVAPSSHSASRNPHLAMIAPFALGSPLLEFCAPAFSEFSDSPQRRALVAHFCNVLSHLIVFREESGNAFQQLVLPLTQSSSPVMNAIYALASAHLEYRCAENGEKSLYFHNKAIQGLAKIIEQDSRTNRNELLATIMLLVYYEVLVQRGQSNIVDGHLKGALTIMCTNQQPSDDPTGIFLERAFRFYDVIAALSNGTAPLSAAPAAGCLQPFPPLGALAASPLSNVDTLLGMATTLWPVIHRLATLLSLKAELESTMQAEPTSTKVAVLRTEFETTAEAIETILSQWQPTLPPDFFAEEFPSEDLDAITPTSYPGGTTPDSSPPSPSPSSSSPTSPPPPCCPFATPSPRQPPPPPRCDRDGLHSIVHSALAYKHGALVYLYRTVRGLDRAHAAVQRHARAGLAHCEATVRAGGPMGALLWPLFVAACEAVSAADRGAAGRAFEGIERRQGMRNIGRAWGIVREVWRRADEEEEEWERGGLGDHEDDRDTLGYYVDGEIAGGARREGATCPATGDSRRPTSARLGRGHGHKAGRSADLWRRVSKDMGVNIVFG